MAKSFFYIAVISLMGSLNCFAADEESTSFDYASKYVGAYERSKSSVADEPKEELAPSLELPEAPPKELVEQYRTVKKSKKVFRAIAATKKINQNKIVSKPIDRKYKKAFARKASPTTVVRRIPATDQLLRRASPEVIPGMRIE